MRRITAVVVAIVALVDKLKATSSNHGTYDPVMGYGIVDADAATR